MSQQPKLVYEFGPFRLDPRERLLARAGATVPLTPKLFDTLLALIESSGQLVEKDELMERVWPDAIVEDRSLTQNIFLLRKTLTDHGAESNYIETVPKRGYRFVAAVAQSLDQGAALIVQRHFKAHLIAEATSLAGPPAATVMLHRLDVKGNQRPGIASWGRHRQVVTFCLLIGLAGGLGFALLRLQASSKPLALRNVGAVKTVAVLPFQPINADQNDEHLSLGMADALIMKLGSLRQIIVRPTSSVRRYSNADQDPAVIGRALRVDSVLRGSVERDGDRMRVRVELLSVEDGRQLWAANLDVKSGDLFAVQDAIAEDLTRALAMKLTGDERRLLAKRYTEDTDAYRAYVTGRFFWNKRTGEGLKKAIACFEQAVEKDPNYALAYTGLADCYSVLSNYTPTSAKDAFKKAKAMALRARALDDTLAEGHTSLAYASIKLDWDWPAADAEFKRSIDLAAIGEYQAAARASGRAPDLLLWHAYALSGNPSKTRQALVEIEKRRKPNSISPVTLALVYASVGDTDRAFALLEEGLAGQDDGLTYLKVDPLWDSLRSDARFANLLRRVGLAS